jgi:hypothetical protein
VGQVHGNIIGKGGINVQSIMALTSTIVRFPKANLDSSIFITGPKESAKTVHMYLQGLLPLYMLFDIAGECAGSLLALVGDSCHPPSYLFSRAPVGPLFRPCVTVTLRASL